MGAVEIVGLGGDGSGIGKRMAVVNREGSEGCAQGGGAGGSTLAAAVAQHALIGGKPQQGYGRGFGLVDNAMPARVLGAGTIGAAGPLGGGSKKWG